jgi:peptidoglycan hydrolase-like protein with peptidoglycan-binding domain
MASSQPVDLDNCPMLSEGYQGGCVSQLQTELNTILGLNLSVDGTFGSTTEKAVERFQQEHNIVPADGIVGPQTKAAIDNPGSSSAGTPPGQLNPGQQITSGTQIASPDGQFVLQMQGDGNLVLRAPGNIPLGDTHTAGHDGTIALMQTDGNFVLTAPGNIPVWASGTDGHPGTVLQVQDDGDVVLYAPGHQFLRVLFPASPDPQNSVPAPTVPMATAPAPGPSVPAPGASDASTAPSTPAPLRYVALGDSYSSGEGLAPFQPGSDTPTDTCHRSDQAYSQYVTPKPDVFAACSGQTTAALTKAVMSGQEPDQDSRLDQNTGLVTFTFGGNDADWTSALTACTKLQTEVLHSTVYGNPAGCNQQLSELPGRIEMMKENLITVYTTLLGDHAAPNAQVRVLNYPPLFPDRGGNTSGCRIGRINPAGLQLVIAHDVEQKFVALEQQANAAIAAAVSQVRNSVAGGDRLQLVDVDSQFGGYTGHTISCGDTGRPTPWINALRMSSSQAALLALDASGGNWDQLNTDLFDVYSASFHPTHEGQYQMYLALSAELPNGWH